MKEDKNKYIPEDIEIKITGKEINNIVTNYDNNNANQIRTAGGIEYTLYEMMAKKFMKKVYPEEIAKAINDGFIYAHDGGQELIKGINCLSGNNRIIIKDSNGNVSYCNLDDFVNNKFDKDIYYVPTINIETGVMEWKRVVNAYSSGVKPVYKLKFSKGLTIECTNDHKFIKASSKTKNNYYFANKRKKYVSLDDGLTKEMNVLSNYKIDYNSDNDYYESALFGFFLGDGTFNKKKKSIRFSFKKRDKAQYLEYLCGKLDLEYTKTETKNNYVNYFFNGLKGDVWYSKSDLIEKYFNKLNLKGVFEGLLNSDGSLVLDSNNNVRINYVSTNKEIIDLWNLCLLCLGLKHSFNCYKHNDDIRQDSYSSTSTGGIVKNVLNNIYLREDFYNKFINSSDNKKEYRNNTRYVLKDYEYTGIKETYNLSIEDNHNYMAGIGGFLSVKNCFTINPRFALRKGVSSYGDNHLGVTTKPAKYFSTAVEHLAQYLGLASTYIAGGVAIPSFNVFLAPYVKDMCDKDIEQVIQGFMFQMNEAYKNRGSQSLFSSIGIDLEVPEFLKNDQAVVSGGIYDGSVYGDYEEEAKKIAHLITKVSYAGDGLNKPLFFPNLIYNIDNANLDEWIDIFELTTKFALPYFSCPSNNGVEYASTLGCRSSLPSNWTGDPNIDCMGTGNSVYTTINLPAIALKCKYINEDINTFYKELDYYMELVRKYNLGRLDRIKWLWYDQRLADFMTQEFDGEPLYRLEDATIVCGYLGLSECLQILYDTTLAEDNEKAREIMRHMRRNTDKWKQEDNLRWGLFQTPAENACYTLAKKMVKKYGLKKSCAKGPAEAPFYTNSNHIPVDEDVPLGLRLKIEGNNQPIGPAGNIMNVYTSEAFSDPTAIKGLVEKIRDKTNAYFWAITGEYSICTKCNTTFRGIKEDCPFCRSECDVFSRITGYVTNTSSWNAGKKSEFELRKRY